MGSIKKFVGFSLGPILGAFFSVVSVPICTHYLLPNEYGKTSMFNLLYTILLMVGYFGFDQAFLREYHEYDNKAKVLFNSMIIPSFITIILIILVIPFAPRISYFLFKSELHADVVYLLLGAFPFLLLENFILLLLRMEERALEYSIFSLFIKFIAFICTMLFLFEIRQDFLAIIYSTIITNYIVDAIDSVSSKLGIIEYATQNNIPIISSMGTGNKLDPTKIGNTINSSTILLLTKIPITS